MTVALVTGGAGGLGSAVVRRLAAGGWRVVVLDRAEGADVVGDVLDDAAVGAAIELARSSGELRLLVNVAGGVGGGVLVGDDGRVHDRPSFERVLASNATGTFNVTRLVAAAMAANSPDADGQRGVVVHTSSVSAFEGQRGQVAYAAAKAAIAGMTLPMARDLAPLGVRVVTIAPGPMATPAMLAVVDRLPSDPRVGIPFPSRLGSPEEFALLVESVVADPYLNGCTIRLDGALRLAPA